MGGCRLRGGLVLVLVVGMPHLPPKHPPRMPDADLTHIPYFTHYPVLVLGKGVGEGEGHALALPEASDSYT
jgi:hypothetical protein